jgi:hypothetical protein
VKSETATDSTSMNPEQLAYWYFRLNGFVTTVTFGVHPEEGSEQRTDVDVLGVRSPHRAELLNQRWLMVRPSLKRRVVLTS